MKKIMIYLINMSMALILGAYLGIFIKPLIFVTFKPTIIKGSYIRNINTPNLGTEKVKKILDKFNKMGYTKIVNSEGWRPIDITETKELPGSMIGVARVELNSCTISLETTTLSKDNYMAERVIIHEYLHCLGYHHTSDPYDLMFASYNDSSEENMRKYAIDVYNRLRQW